MANRGAGDPVTRLPAGRRRCPICGKPAAPAHQPFCSAHCVNIDLGRWLDGNYRVPTEDPPDDDPDHGEG
jgi:endogenous inhibitor of DNA gyrase (YacG/DUF329 family)